MIIFGLILTTFELSSIFGVSWDSIENWLLPKIGQPAWPNLWNALYNASFLTFLTKNLRNLCLVLFADLGDKDAGEVVPADPIAQVVGDRRPLVPRWPSPCQRWRQDRMVRGNLNNNFFWLFNPSAHLFLRVLCFELCKWPFK